MTFFIITLVIIGIWMITAFIGYDRSDFEDNTEDSESCEQHSADTEPPEENNDKSGYGEKVAKTVVIILLIVLAIGIIGFMEAMNGLGDLFDSCCGELDSCKGMG